jgi:hypothetical protein
MRVARTLLFGVGLSVSLFLLQPRFASAQGVPDWPTGGTGPQPVVQEPGQPAPNAGGLTWAAGVVSDLRTGLLIPSSISGPRTALIVSNWISPAPRRSVGEASLARPTRRGIGR